MPTYAWTSLSPEQLKLPGHNTNYNPVHTYALIPMSRANIDDRDSARRDVDITELKQADIHFMKLEMQTSTQDGTWMKCQRHTS
jgi:hypothetical protein